MKAGTFRMRCSAHWIAASATAFALSITACSVFDAARTDPRPYSGPSWDDAHVPIVIGHRGSANVVAPENTFAAFASAAASGAALETDVRRTVDGMFVLLHDVDVDRTTGVAAGPVSGLPWQFVRQLDASYPFHPEVFSPQRIPAFDDFLETYGPGHLLVPEVKGTLPEGLDLARAILRSGLAPGVLVQSRDPAVLSAIALLGPSLRTALTSTDQVSPATAVSTHVWAVLVNQIHVDASYVEQMHGSGVKVFAWVVNSLTGAERMLDASVDGILTDDPALITQARHFTVRGETTVAMPSRFVGSGWRPYTSIAGAKSAVVQDVVTFAPAATVENASFSAVYLPGVRFDPLPADERIDVTLVAQQLPDSGDLTRFLGVRFCWSTDDDYSLLGGAGTHGYYFAYRLTGEVEIARVNDGTRAVLATAAWSPLALGERIPIRVTVTSTGITVVRADTGATISATDGQLARDGFVTVYGSGVVPGVAAATVAY